MENWFDRKRVMVLAVVLVFVGVGAYFYEQYSDSKEQEGKSALYKVQKTFDDELKAIPESDRMAGMVLDVDSKFSKTVSELNGLMSAKSSSNRTLFEASYRLGTLYLEYRQPEKAVSALTKGVGYAKSGIQKASLQYLLGTSFEQTSKFKEAMVAFQDGLTQNIDALKSEFLLGLMRTHLQLKELDKAKLVSDRITKELSGRKALETATALLKAAK